MTRKRDNGEGSIYPYRNGYAAHVWIITPAGKRQRKVVYGKTREVVHARWLALHTKAAAGPVAPRVPTLAEYLQRWLVEVVNPTLAPATAANYEMFVRLYIVPDLGKRAVDKLMVREVRTWLNLLRTRCQCCAQKKDERRAKPRCCAIGKCCRQLPSDWTVHQAWTVLSAALSNAVRDELVAKNVASLVRVPVPRPRRAKPWTVDEARRFLESAKQAGDPLYAAYVLILVLGLRRGEVLGLAWKEIDLVSQELYITWQIQRVRGELIRRETKTASSEAPLPLPAICLTALRSRLRQQEDWRAEAGSAWQDTGFVTTTKLGQPVDPRNFHRVFKTRCRAAKVPVISVHTTRRTCASMLVALDVHPRVAMQILRHSQIAVTMNIYSEVSSAEAREALRKLGEQLDE